MSELKTKPTDSSVMDYLNSVSDAKKREDSIKIYELIKEVTNAEPKMWGSAIVGFVDHHYKYESGREGDWFKTGFSVRKQSITLYFMCGVEKLQSRLDLLGRHKVGKGCIYINKLEDINLDVLRDIVRTSISE